MEFEQSSAPASGQVGSVEQRMARLEERLGHLRQGMRRNETFYGGLYGVAREITASGGGPAAGLRAWVEPPRAR